MNRLNGQADVPNAWIQLPSVRGADALFMAQWALAGHYLTRDERFLDFLDTLMADTDFWQVVDTMGSFWLPSYGDLHARIQWPMQGLSAAFWTGRMQGTIKAGEGLALGWRPTPAPCP